MTMLNPADVALTNSKAKLDEVIPTRTVRRKSDGQQVLVDERTFDAALYVEEAEYQAEQAPSNNAL